MLAQYTDFFAASATSSATLVGLLFVVLAVDTNIDKDARRKQYMLSETAFIALGGIFLVSLIALLPSGLVLMAVASLILSFGGSWFLIDRARRSRNDDYIPRDVWFVVVTIGVYALLALTSIWLLVHGESIFVLNIFNLLLAFLYALSLLRAWRTLIIFKRAANT